ncbi:hypothetical protein FCL47_16140 [Desulfopila sp. IMCC35006]|uniref:PEP/pyruvate-binding domain-containing protein n=1 Tax=Desulfopila sp. IMCC35006 TaxID=2569542 RepID=UPI0010ABA08E|nr:PEP/pyruvate-binding domain-containing protein [Desulfopila sp. IMCC35006]TKB24773.1 hypothetical protein FCL47_16140 [Desulfopila sp. IMCC35006]
MLDILKQFSEQLISPDLFIRKRYATFQQLLDCDRRCHRLLADLEDIYYNTRPVDINQIRSLYRDFSADVLAMLNCLTKLAPGRYKNLIDYYKKIDFYARFALAPPPCDINRPYTLPVAASHADDRRTGGKGLHLSHLAGNLGLPVPDGFIISTSAFNALLESNNLRAKINRELARTDIHSLTSLQETANALTALVGAAKIPADLEQEINTAVSTLAAQYPGQKFAVRSSAVGEDSSLSFAGQYCSLLNIEKDSLLTAYRQVLVGKYTPEAILYRIINGLDDEETPMAVIVLVMVEARLSGVVATGNPATADDTTILVHSVRGLGDTLMAGQESATTQELHQVDGSTVITRHSPGRVAEELSDEQIHALAGWAQQITAYYGIPQEIEWSCDTGDTMYLLQARRLLLERSKTETKEPDLSQLSLLFQSGATAAPGIGCGPVCHLPAPDQLQTIANGSILVCDVTPPSLVTLLPRLAGVIARYGSTADHFSSVAREFRIPVLVQAGEHCLHLTNGEPLTLWAEKQSVFRGTVKLADDTSGPNQRTGKSPLFNTLKMVIDFTSPLALIDPASSDFRPENCRSLHDIIRFSHEKAVQAMFIHSTDSLLRKPKGVQLQSDIPLQMHIIDVGGGLMRDTVDREKITMADIRCLPLKALWQGLSHSQVHWRDRAHFDWQSYDSIALAGGVATKGDASLASFCLISTEYLNVNMRFGYHFTLLDSLCGETSDENYILLRFAGGGGNSLGKDLRLLFIAKVLTKLNFTCEQTGELLDARLMRYDKNITAARLDQVGRLLGAVRLLDMVLTHEHMIEPMVDAFFQGKYDFSNE